MVSYEHLKGTNKIGKYSYTVAAGGKNHEAVNPHHGVTSSVPIVI